MADLPQRQNKVGGGMPIFFALAQDHLILTHPTGLLE